MFEYTAQSYTPLFDGIAFYLSVLRICGFSIDGINSSEL